MIKKRRIISILLTLYILLMGCNRYETEDLDIVKYEKNEYIFLELPANEFYYDYNGNSHDRFEEVDGIYPINPQPHPR